VKQIAEDVAGHARIDPPPKHGGSRVYPKRILAAVVDFYEVEPALLAKRHDPHIARAVAAWLCRRHTEATLAELAEWLGLSRADSAPNLTRRLEAQLKSQPELLDDFAAIL
jgi:chromosomal replication initiation ATPase DnaA